MSSIVSLSSSSFLKNVKFVRIAPSGEGIETATQGANA
jgi:hypothetical protein